MELRSTFTTLRQKRNANDGGLGNRVPARKKRKTSKLPDTLFKCINEADIETTVDTFLNMYLEDKMQGVFNVKICILQAAGCFRKYNRNMGEDDNDILSYFEDWNERKGGQSFFTGRNCKIFHSRFCEFIERLIRAFEIREMLYDRILLDKLILFYGFVVKSEVVSFRHAATLSALTTMTTLISIIASKSEQIRKHNSQLNTEMQKPEDQKELLRVQMLENNIRILNKNLTQVKSNLQRLRNLVFENAINDNNTKIRSICFIEIGEWLHFYPKLVFEDKYLNHLLPPLANKVEVAAVRMTCVSILKSLFDGDYGVMGERFAKDIKNVLLRLALCCEAKLSSDAFRLLSKISKFNVLEDGESEQFYKYVYLDNPFRAIGRGAGEFIVGLLTRNANEDLSDEESEAPTSFKTRFLFHLVDFHIRNGIPGNSALLVDSVDRWTPILQDWKTLKTFLLEETMSDKEKTTFIEILASCIRKAGGGDVAVTQIDSITKKKRKKYSEVFCDDLPQLIRCFRDDPGKICNILRFTRCISLDTYVELRKEISFIELLQEINEVMKVSSNFKVLEECALTLKALCVEEHSTYAKCMLVCQLAGEYLEKQCIKTIDDFYNMDSSFELEQSDLLSALKRVTAFSRFFNMYDETLFSRMMSYMNDYLSNEDDNFSVKCAKYSFFSCLNMLTAATRNIFDLKKCDELQINFIRLMLSDFMSFGRALHLIKDDNFRCEAFQGICQALIVFSNGMTDMFELQDLKSLVYKPPTPFAGELSIFLKEGIFAKFIPNVEEAARRRRGLYAFCRLHVHSIIGDLKACVEIFRHYIKFTAIFKDIMDGMIAVIKKQDEMKFALIIHKCLKLEFVKIQSISSLEEKAEETDALKRLVKHFSSVLKEKGHDPEQQRAIVFLHEKGIKFSMAPSDDRATKQNAPPPNLNYLEILKIFVELLTSKGCKDTYQCLRCCEPFEETSHWIPFVKYRKALENGMVGVRSRRKSSFSHRS